jgi:hypothetical protein
MLRGRARRGASLMSRLWPMDDYHKINIKYYLLVGGWDGVIKCLRFRGGLRDAIMRVLNRSFDQIILGCLLNSKSDYWGKV